MSDDKHASIKSDRKIDDKYNDASADCRLVSSDGVEFRTMKYHLQSVSPVFRQALVTSGTTALHPPTIELTHPKFEHSRIVRTFLDALDNSWAPLGRPVTDVHGEFIVVEHLLAFCDKWQCSLLTKALLGSLPAFINADDNAYTSFCGPFLVAAQYEDADLCQSLIASWAVHGVKVWDEDDQGGDWIGKAIDEHSLLDPMVMPLDVAKRLSYGYYWALSRAMGLCRAKHNNLWLEKEDYALVAEEFGKNIREWKAWTG